MLLFLGHRIADRPLLGLICKRLLVGVMEDGRRVAAIKGTPQGGAATDCQKAYACDVAGNSGRTETSTPRICSGLGSVAFPSCHGD